MWSLLYHLIFRSLNTYVVLNFLYVSQYFLPRFFRETSWDCRVWIEISYDTKKLRKFLLSCTSYTRGVRVWHLGNCNSWTMLKGQDQSCSYSFKGTFSDYLNYKKIFKLSDDVHMLLKWNIIQISVCWQDELI